MANGPYATRQPPQHNFYDSAPAGRAPQEYGPEYDQSYNDPYRQEPNGYDYGQYNQNPYADNNRYDGPNNGKPLNGGFPGGGGYDQGYGNSLPYREKQSPPRPEVRGGNGMAPSDQRMFHDVAHSRERSYAQTATAPNNFNFSRNAAVPSPHGRAKPPYADQDQRDRGGHAQYSDQRGGSRSPYEYPNGHDSYGANNRAGMPSQTGYGEAYGSAGVPPNQLPSYNYRHEQSPVHGGDVRRQGSEQHYPSSYDTRTPHTAELYDPLQELQAPASVTGFYGDQTHFQNNSRPGTAPSSSEQSRYQRNSPLGSQYDSRHDRPPVRREVSDSNAHPRQQQQMYGRYDQQGPRGAPQPSALSPHEYANGVSSGPPQASFNFGNDSSRQRDHGVFEMPGDVPSQGEPGHAYSDGDWRRQDYQAGYDGYGEPSQHDHYLQGREDFPLQHPGMHRNDTYDTSYSDPGPQQFTNGAPRAGANDYRRPPADQVRSRDPRQQMRQQPSREAMSRQRHPRDPRDPRDERDRHDPRDRRPPRDLRDARDPRDPRDARSGRGPPDDRALRDPRRQPAQDYMPQDRNEYGARAGPRNPPDDRQQQRRGDHGHHNRAPDRSQPDLGFNGRAVPPQPRSAGPTPNGFQPEPSERSGPTSPYERPKTAPNSSLAGGRLGPQGLAAPNGPTPKSGQPPIRPGLQQQPSAQPARPPPVRNYTMNASQPSDPPSSKEKASRRESEPITQDTLSRIKNQAMAAPGDNKLQFKLAKSLVEASTVLADEGGRADQATRSRNSKRYTSEALQIIRKLSAASYPDAMFYLADSYSTGSLGLDNDPKDAFNLYQAAAKGGNPVAAYRTAVCCEIGPEEGGGTRKDVLKAVQWYKRAASLDDVPAMYKLGMISLNGLLSQEKNVADGLRWLKQAADKANEENPHALHELGLLYETGAHSGLIPRDEAYASQLFTRAAKLGYRFSQFKLGKAFEFGELGNAIDARSSIVWYTKAAAQGEHQSELALSGWYLTGSEGILEHSDTEADLWARKAASANPPLSKALFALGYYLEVGIGAPRSLEEAKKWYGRAASYGFPKAQERLEELKRGGARAQKDRERLSRSNPKKQDAECTVM
ncbi:MAG: hypothetical protein M1828_004565 [Chrysothrix sp. TS-e1954]|nr:MAG: hypothetical protein M1828_004565 [Chrysothrix sp. TS-e1954]